MICVFPKSEISPRAKYYYTTTLEIYNCDIGAMVRTGHRGRARALISGASRRRPGFILIELRQAPHLPDSGIPNTRSRRRPLFSGHLVSP